MATQTKKKVVAVQKKSTTTARKGVKRKVALVCAAGEECFWANDGQVLSSLGDLLLALKHMPSHVYAHHVTPERNDFADWVEFVLVDKKCADGLRKAKDQKSAIACVTKGLAEYE